MEDELWWKTNLYGSLSLMEDNLSWRTSFNQRQPLIKDEGIFKYYSSSLRGDWLKWLMLLTQSWVAECLRWACWCNAGINQNVIKYSWNQWWLTLVILCLNGKCISVSFPWPLGRNICLYQWFWHPTYPFRCFDWAVQCHTQVYVDNLKNKDDHKSKDDLKMGTNKENKDNLKK